jgi:replication-associated recombination protein RarA
MLRRLVAADLPEQVAAYAQFLVQVTRLACVQFAPGDSQAAGTASAIAATITRYAPVSNTQLEPQPQPQEDVEDLGGALDDLERLVGLEAAKREINEQVQLIRITQMRAAAGLKNPTVGRHLVFVGNPGTGKTTVARIVGRIYRALKVVPDGHLVETDASGLVAGYVGQTAIKTAEQITAALGGILFIDEAYGLTRNDFGLEAIDTLVKGMEDHRDELVVIVAGYTTEMGEFLSANPGLQSRFPTTITFDDYSADELLEILRRIATDHDYVVPADDRLATAIGARMGQTAFGNAREMRNMFEAAVRRQAWRLRDVSEATVEQMKTLTVEDLLG